LGHSRGPTAPPAFPCHILTPERVVRPAFAAFQLFGIVPRFLGKRLSGKKAFIALGLTAGNKTTAIRQRRTRAVVLVADEAINAIGCSGTEQPECPFCGSTHLLRGELLSGSDIGRTFQPKGRLIISTLSGRPSPPGWQGLLCRCLPGAGRWRPSRGLLPQRQCLFAVSRRCAD